MSKVAGTDENRDIKDLKAKWNSFFINYYQNSQKIDDNFVKSVGDDPKFKEIKEIFSNFSPSKMQEKIDWVNKELKEIEERKTPSGKLHPRFSWGTRYNELHDYINKMNQSLAILRLGAGGQQMLNDYCGIRLIFNWEKTSKFKKIVSKEFPTSIDRVSIKNSWGYGIGFFVRY